MKQLESDLQSLDSFENPKSLLEQYQTPPRVAAQILHMINIDVDLSGKVVLDLGCGCGILGLGCMNLGAGRVLGIDIDKEALIVAEQNRDDVGLTSDTVSFLQQDVVHMVEGNLPPDMNRFDIVVSNPPFGIRTHDCRNIDQLFVKKGLEFSDVVYFLHKSSIRNFWEKKAKEMKVKVEFLIEDMDFPIKCTYNFHTLDEQNITVDLVKFSKNI